MKRTIYKYPLTFDERQIVPLPVGFQPRLTGTQGETLYLWAEIDPEAPRRPHVIHVYCTGDFFDPTGQTYLGSTQMGAYVWHVYVEGTSIGERTP